MGHFHGNSGVGKRNSGNVVENLSIRADLGLTVVLLGKLDVSGCDGDLTVGDNLKPALSPLVGVFHQIVERFRQIVLYLIHIGTRNLFSCPGLFPLLHLGQFLTLVAGDGVLELLGPS